jgi:hypothetical protein
MRLIDEWQWVLRKAWSFRLLAIAAVLSGLEVVISVMVAYGVKTPLPVGIFAALAGVVTIAAMVARFVAQVRD